MNRRFIQMVVVLGTMACYCIINAKIETGSTVGIEVDLSKPFSIVWPCEIDYMDDFIHKSLRIPANVGRGWLNEAGGSATYKVFAQEEDEYCVWIYSKWYDECTNAVFVTINEQDKVIVGNDPVYQQWHWVRGFSVHLKKGTHTVTLSNHSDNIEIAKLVLINSEIAEPQDSEVTFSDLFYDGFDGCDEGNFSSWQIVTGQWQVMDPATQACMAENSLKGASESEAMIVLADETWQNYSLDIEITPVLFKAGECQIGLCIGVQDLDNYYGLSFALKDSDISTIVLNVIRMASGEATVVSSHEMPRPQKDKWLLHVETGSEAIGILLNDHRIEAPLYNETPVRGGIGLLLKGRTVAYFDNIHVSKSKNNIGQLNK